MSYENVYYILNELNVFHALWRAWKRQPVCIITTRSIISGTKSSFLEKLTNHLRKNGRIQNLDKDRPDLVNYPLKNDLVRATDVYAECELWMEDRFRFQDSDNQFGIYATAYRTACSGTSFDRYILAYKVIEIIKTEYKSRIFGLDKLDASYLKYRFGQHVPLTQMPSFPFVISNFGLFLCFTFYTWLWILVRVRFAIRPQAHFHVAFDFAAHPDNTYVMSELSDSSTDLLVLFRSSTDKEKHENSIEGRPCALPTDGRFSLVGGVAAMSQSFCDHLKIFGRAGMLPTDYFRQLIKLPFRRFMFRGLFNRYYCKYFWARDDYNPEHSLRSLELRQKGAVSLGFMHGVPSVAVILHQVRHIDFDIYYVSGKYQADEIYKKWWPRHMAVRPVGSFGVSREFCSKLANSNDRKNVACFIGITFQLEETLDTINQLARKFSHRIFYINYRRGDMDNPYFGGQVNDFFASSPSNVVHYSGRSYDLFLTCDITISEGTTLAAEAIQFGLSSFLIDYHPDVWKALSYRDFPGACINSPEDMIKRFEDIESGKWLFPRSEWESFIELSGVIPWDVIRQDMGLAPKEYCVSNDVNEPKSAEDIGHRKFT